MFRPTRTMQHFLVAICLTIAVILTESRIQANDHIRKLGKDPLGESLKEFQVRYPKAICGAETRPRKLTSANSDGKVGCYLDDRDSLARISPSPFLNLGVAAVSAIFWNGKLYNLIFDLNVGSIRTVLGSFEKIYGPPILIAMDDPADATKLTYVSWIEGDTRLQVRLSKPGEKDSTHLKGQKDVETVRVDLFDGDLRPETDLL
jgi:hypothetical protein